MLIINTNMEFTAINFLDICHVYLDRRLITSIRFCFHQKPPKRDSLALSAKSRPACIVWRRPLH